MIKLLGFFTGFDMVIPIFGYKIPLLLIMSFIYLFLNSFNNKLRIKFNLINFSFLLIIIYFITSNYFLSIEGRVKNLSFFMNIFMDIIIFSYLLIGNNLKRKELISYFYYLVYGRFLMDILLILFYIINIYSFRLLINGNIYGFLDVPRKYFLTWPNSYSALSLVSIFLVLEILKDIKFKKIILLTHFFVVFLSFSRGAYLGLFIMLVLRYSVKLGFVKKMILIFSVAIFSILLIYFFVFSTSNNYYSNKFYSNKFYNYFLFSATGRFKNNDILMNIFIEENSQLLGCGGQNFQEGYPTFNSSNALYINPHNSYYDIIYRYGYIGFFIYMGFFIFSILTYLKVNKKFIIIIIPFLFISYFQIFFRHINLMSFFVLILAYLNQKQIKEKI